MHTRKFSAAYNNTSLASLKGGMLNVIGFIALLAFVQDAAAQARDTTFTKVIEVDQIPRSIYARMPSVASDEDENFMVAWSAESKGRPEIFMRRFDAIGRPLTDIRALSQFVGDSLNIENAQLYYVGNGFTWIVWQQRRLRANSQVAGMIVNQDFKVARAPFLLHVDPDPYSRPRVVMDGKGRVMVTWIVDTLPVAVVARLFNRDGTPLTGLFNLTQDSQVFTIGEPLAVAASAAGTFAVAWHAYEANADLIYLRMFTDENKFTNDPIAVTQRGVSYPSVAFTNAEELVVQWFNAALAPALYAQRFGLNAKPLSQATAIVSGIDRLPRAAIVAARERGTFETFWSVTEPRDTTASQIFTRSFLSNLEPLTPKRSLARTPQRVNFLTEIDANLLPSGNYVLAYTGNDTSITLPAPRVGAIISKTALADLYVFDLVISPPNPTRADSVKASFKVRNIGFAPAPASFALLDLTTNAQAQLVAVPPLRVDETRTFTFNLGALQPHSYTLRVTADDSQEIFEADEKNNVASLLFNVGEAPTLAIEPATLDFAGIFGQPNPAAQTVVVKNSGSGTLRWNATAAAPWIKFTPDTGTVTTTSQVINVRIDLTGLAPGSYQSNLVVNSNGGRAVVGVNLTVAAPLPSLQFSPSTLVFAATQGGVDPPAKYVVLRNAGSGTLTAKLTSNQPWLFLKPDTMATSQRDSVQALVVLGKLTAGTYSGTITIRSNGGVGTVNVTLNVSPQPPVLEVSPRSLNFVATEGTANPPAQSISVRNLGGGTLQWSVINQETWLAFDPRSGSTTTEVDVFNVTANVARLAPGTYTGVFQVNAEPGGKLEVRVNFTVNPRPRYPDLVVLAQSRELANCYAADYGFLTTFVVQNLGEAAAGPSLAQLSFNNEVRQRQTVPSLEVGASYTLQFAAENLRSGFTPVACEVGVGATFQESATSNNVVRYSEWVPRRGDVNADSVVNLQDLFRLVDLVLQRNVAQSSLQECWAANVNVDAGLDIADIVAFIDALLNSSGTTNIAQGGELDLQLTALPEQKTRLHWRSAAPLRAWQATWKLPQSSVHATALHSFQRNGFEVDWKIVQNELQLLVWRVHETATSNETQHDFELPLVLAQENLAQVLGASANGALQQLTPKTIGSALPQSFRLSPAYPNPWRRNAARNIVWQYEAPAPAVTELRLYNVLGQEVRHLSFGFMPAGRGEMQWDGRDNGGREAAPGIYFVELIAGKFKQRQRLVVF